MGLRDEIEESKRDIERYVRLIERGDARESDLASTAREIRNKIVRKRKRRQSLEVEHADWSEERLNERREQLADEIDELEAWLDRVVERLDNIRVKTADAEGELTKERERLVRLRKKRQEMRENQAGQMSPHFHRSEFDCRDGTPVPDAAIPALRDLCMDFLEPLRASGGVVYINSGYRTRSYNAAIGGVGNSVHIYDEKPSMVAADHMQSGRSPSEVADFHENNPKDDLQAIGLGRYATFTHIDNRGRGGWPESRWYG
jgi:predicted RNase H-like nuclease (RuvC/YqgF family)